MRTVIANLKEDAIDTDRDLRQRHRTRAQHPNAEVGGDHGEFVLLVLDRIGIERGLRADRITRSSGIASPRAIDNSRLGVGTETPIAAIVGAEHAADIVIEIPIHFLGIVRIEIEANEFARRHFPGFRQGDQVVPILDLISRATFWRPVPPFGGHRPLALASTAGAFWQLGASFFLLVAGMAAGPGGMAVGGEAGRALDGSTASHVLLCSWRAEPRKR